MELIQRYRKEIIPSLQKQLGLQKVMQVPRLEKIVLNMGLGDGKDKKRVSKAAEELTLIAGQRSVLTYARASIAGFNIREGWPIGCKVTLRSNKMYDFIERLIKIALPRVRDFRGVSIKSFDGRGNYSLGIREQIVFPEIDYDRIDSINGLDVVIVTSTNNDKWAAALLAAFGMPFRDFERAGFASKERSEGS